MKCFSCGYKQIGKQENYCKNCGIKLEIRTNSKLPIKVLITCFIFGILVLLISILLLQWQYYKCTTSIIENWKYVEGNFYVDINSLVNQGGYLTGRFKEIPNKKEHINGRMVAYKIITIGAFCDSKQLEYPIFEYYDSENNLIDEINIYKQYSNGHLGVQQLEDDPNGMIYYNALCQS